MKQLIAATMVVVTVLTGSVAFAAEPVDTAAPAMTIPVTVEDITAVADQISAYDKEIDMLAQLMYKEARGVKSTAQQAAVAWCVLNRYDAGYESSIAAVITARAQFAYSRHAPVTDELRALAQDVMMRWLLELRGVENVGRVLPADYVYFAGRRGINWFRSSYRTRRYWDWSLPDPYEAVNDAKNID